ncbi:MAG: phosphatidylinositol mannoside acyltransferase [Promicromonosporaceae bacterium]|nr:phosphatidylinositol mannoside acyltransferase [Promicromonosporaceae bacterium]
MASARLFLLGWRLAPKVPEPVLRGTFNLLADLAWLRRGKGVRRLEANYAKIRPELDRRALRRLSRRGMRSYLRYFREAFTLQSLTAEQVNRRVRLVGAENAPEVIEQGGAAVLALGHLGNWDLAGAFATPNIAPVLTVAERLKPQEVYEAFVGYRSSIGIEVLGLGESGVFDALVAGARGRRRIICLLADRDLSHTGVEVRLAGHQAWVAAGPATVALRAGVRLHPTSSTYERVRGAERKAVGSPWRMVLHVHPAVAVPPLDGSLPPEEAKREQVRAYTQAWVDVLGSVIKKHTEDWHMLQRVFSADLDLERLPRVK